MLAHRRARIQREYVLLAVVVALSGFLIFAPFAEEPKIFWDEDYHIVFAQKYLNRVFHMEIHPPLGKLFVALGEYLFEFNSDNSQFISLEQTGTTPAGFSLAGYRLFPRIFSFLIAPLLFIVLMASTRDSLISFLFSLGWVLDNAFIVHGRGALLEGIQIFFFLLTLHLVFALRRRMASSSKIGVTTPLCIGACFAATFLVKVTGLILLVPITCCLMNWIRSRPRQTAEIGVTIVTAALFVTLVVWQIHFYLGQKVVPALTNQGLYGGSSVTKAALENGHSGDIFSFPRLLAEHLTFASEFNAKVSRLNLCAPLESGSSPYFWPIGARSIHYQIETYNDDLASYWVLQVNPVVWFAAFIGLLIAASALVSSVLFSVSIEREKRWQMMVLLLTWTFYMVAMLNIERVMYLHHYFIPLMISVILGAIVMPEIKISIRPQRRQFVRATVAAVTILMITLSFYFFSPLTYGFPITAKEFSARSLFRIWDLRVFSGLLSNDIARPVFSPQPPDKLSAL